MPEPCGEVDTVTYSESVAATIVNYYHPAFVVERYTRMPKKHVSKDLEVQILSEALNALVVEFGRHAELRIQYRKVWRFESSLEHCNTICLVGLKMLDVTLSR